MKFGTDDKLVRDRLKTFFEKYVEAGTDQSADVVLQGLMDHYMGQCVSYYASRIDPCVDLEIGSEQFNKCVEPIDKHFEEMWIIFVRDELKAGTLIDFDDFSVDKLEREFREDRVGYLRE